MSKKNTTSVKSAPRKNAKNVSSEERATLYTQSHVKNVAFSDKRPGVISHIVSCLDTDEKHAMSKDELLASLVETFPDREEAKMKSTLMMQVPSGLKIEKALIVKTVVRPDGKRGYVIDHAASAIAQREREEAKLAKARAKLAEQAKK